MIFRSLLRCHALGVCLLWSSLGQAATIYDAAAQFSGTVNTNSSLWSYRTGATRTGSYTLLDIPPASSSLGGSWVPGPNAAISRAWQLAGSPGQSVIPFIGKNETGVTQVEGVVFPVTWPADTIMVHPDTNEFAVVSWLSPGAGTVDISYQFTDAQPFNFGPDGIQWYVDRNAGAGADGLAAGAFNDGGDSGLLSVTGVSISAGDRLNFIAALQAAGPNANSTILTATISFTAAPAPEPSSLLLAACGGLGFMFRRRQGRQSACSVR